jgi:hypothetical protein
MRGWRDCRTAQVNTNALQLGRISRSMAMGGCRILWPVAGYLTMPRLARAGTWLQSQAWDCVSGIDLRNVGSQCEASHGAMLTSEENGDFDEGASSALLRQPLYFQVDEPLSRYTPRGAARPRSRCIRGCIAITPPLLLSPPGRLYYY